MDSGSGSGGGWTVEDCEIGYFGGEGINTGWDCQPGGTIRGNHVHHNHSTGIQIGKGAHGFVVEHNDVHDNYLNGIDTNASDGIIRYNSSDHNGLDPRSDEDVSDRSGIFVYGGLTSAGEKAYASRNQVYDNTCHFNRRAGILVGCTTAVVIEGNTVERNDTSRNVQSGIFLAGPYKPEHDGECKDTTVRDNISNSNGVVGDDYKAYGLAVQGDLSGYNPVDGNTFCDNETAPYSVNDTVSMGSNTIDCDGPTDPV